MIALIRLKLLRWLKATDNSEHSRILNKYWRESEEKHAIKRRLEFETARWNTAVQEKELALTDCRNGLRSAVLQLSARNVAPIESADRAIEYLRLAMTNSLLPAYADGKIRLAIKELESITIKQEVK